MFRDEYDNIVPSKETAIAYIEERLPGCEINSVKGDGIYILHSFREILDSTGIKVTLEEIKLILKVELSRNTGNFRTSGMNISNKLQLFLNSPMTHYNADPLICSCLHLVTFLIST